MGILDDLAKIAIPAAIGYFGGPAASSMFGGNAMFGGAAASGLGSLLMGNKPKDALKAALLGGLGGYAAPAQAGAAAGAPTQAAIASNAAATRTSPALMQSVMGGGGTGGVGIVNPVTTKANTMSGELLKSLGAAGDTSEGNLLFKALNTNMGEGIAAGLIAQLLAGDEDEGDNNQGSFERRPYGAGGPGGKLGGINYNQGGIVQYLNQGGASQSYPDNPPRRDGPIAPYEGSGTKDDVPALLTAGEFVMTRDAVEGAGGGDVNQGLNRMYSMMDKFEGMA